MRHEHAAATAASRRRPRPRRPLVAGRRTLAAGAADLDLVLLLVGGDVLRLLQHLLLQLVDQLCELGTAAGEGRCYITGFVLFTLFYVLLWV